MGDVPGLDYEPPVTIDRSSLPRWDARPDVGRYEFDGRVVAYLSWEYEEEGERVSSSSSPAHELSSRRDERDLAPGTILNRLWEALEVPGTPSDYHFLIQGAAGALWSQRCGNPAVLASFEQLCWLDIHLLQAASDAVRNETFDEHPEGPEFYRAPAFSQLIALYSREGFLDRALEVAELAERFGQDERALTELREKVAALEAEDAA